MRSKAKGSVKPQKVLLCVLGPTAIGKTALAIALAKHYKTEIISADSRQFYKEMNIGTAVPSTEELETVPHHFIHHISIFDSYSVGDFEREAVALLNSLFKQHDKVILAGGSGLYVDAVVNGLDAFPEIDPKIREDLNASFKTEGLEYLQATLKQLDPKYYEIVDKKNPHRLIRALEVSLATGKPYSFYLNKEKPGRLFKPIFIGLTAERPLIYQRINERVDLMVKNGLVKEAEQLHEYKNLNALQTVGYQELFNYFEGQYDLDTAISEIKKNSRRFAKRQLTWFKRNKDVMWFAFDSPLQTLLAKLSTKIEDS